MLIETSSAPGSLHAYDGRGRTPLTASRFGLLLLVLAAGASVAFIAIVGVPQDLTFGGPTASPSIAALPSASAPALAPAPVAAPASAATPTSRFSFGDPRYTEPSCDDLPDVTDLSSAYRPEAPRPSIEALSKRRYPTGLPFLQAQDDRTLAVWLNGAPSTFEGLAARFDAAVHEGSHIWGVKRFNVATVSYPVRSDLTIDTRRLQNFHRSEVLTMHPEAAGDTYASTYLSGTSGAQGFNTLLDEYNAYAHALASRVCTRDLLAPGTRVSARDGILAMMFYVEVYLRLAREKHPADYAAILKDAGHRRLILTVWDRAEFWLRKSVSFANLGIHDDRIEAWVYAPERLSEIAHVRDAR